MDAGTLLARLFPMVRGPGIQQPFQGGVPNPQFYSGLAAGNIPLVKALQNISKTAGEPFPVPDAGPADFVALFASSGHPNTNPLP